MRRGHPSSGRRDHFFWQGALILLPALVLAGAGFYSLRQDDVLAEHEAVEQARQLAAAFEKQLMAPVDSIELPTAAATRRPPGSPEDDPVGRWVASPLVRAACLVDAANQLVYPPPRTGWPLPAPLDEGELSPAQQDLWLTLEAGWSGLAAVDMRDLDAFIGSQAPARFVALARLRTATALANAGRGGVALSILRALRHETADLVGESGLPLRWLVEAQEVGLIPADARTVPLNALCGRLLLTPSPVADALFDRVVALAPVGQRWQTLRGAHERSRDFHRSYAEETPGSLLLVAGSTTAVVPRSAEEGGRWLMAVPVEALRAEAHRVERSSLKPLHFGVTASLGADPLLPSPPPESRSLARVTAEALPVTVDVFLTDPAAFAAQRRARTARFAALILMSTVTVGIGFVAAWRAFRRQQQLSEMKSNFVSSVSHELRAPIASVRLMAEELEHGRPAGADKVAQYHRFIGLECRRLSAVIENVLDFSRREQGREHFDFEAVDLSELVEETVSLMRHHATERAVRIEISRLGTPDPVSADGRALQRVLVNLIDNALKHAPDDSVVTVGLDYGGDSVQLWVEDAGPGIPRAEHQRIFERFYRIGSELQRQTPGVGLGLSIVKHLAAVHGGRVRVRSDVGQGSRFTVELPLRRPSPAHPSPCS